MDANHAGLALASESTGPVGQGKSSEADGTVLDCAQVLQLADKRVEGSGDGAATYTRLDAGMRAGDAKRLECLVRRVECVVARVEFLRLDAGSDTGLGGGVGGRLGDEECVCSCAPCRCSDELSAAYSCADAECLGCESDEKTRALKEKIQELEEQIGEVEEAEKREMEKARGRILGDYVEAEKCGRQSVGSMFVNADEPVADELLRQCECEMISNLGSERRKDSLKSPLIGLHMQGKVKRASMRGDSGGGEACTLNTHDEYHRLIQNTVDACTPDPKPPCTEALHTLTRALQLRNKYLERQLEEASEMYDSTVQDLSWNIDMLRVVEEEVEELREEKDAALKEVEGLKKMLYREKERNEECQEAHADQRPCDESSYHLCKHSVAAPSSVPPTSFIFYPSRSVIIVPGAPAQILQFPPGTTLHGIKDSLDYAFWSGAEIDDCGLAVKNIMNARSRIGIELPFPLSDQVVVISLPPRQLREGGDQKKSLSQSAGKALRDKKKGADKSVKMAAWETVDRDEYVESAPQESSEGDGCSGRASPREPRDEQIDKTVKIAARETLDGDDYVEFLPRTKEAKKSSPRWEDEHKNTAHVQTSRPAGSMKIKPESSYIHEAYYTPVPQPRGYCCSHCQPRPASTVDAFPYISSVSVRGGCGDSNDEDNEKDDGNSDDGDDYFVLNPNEINDDVDHEDDPPSPETKYKNYPYGDSTADFEWEQGLSWYPFGDEEHGNVRLRGGGGDGVYEHEQPTYDQGWQTEWEQHLTHRAIITEDFDPFTAGPREPPPPRTPRREHAIRLENYKRAIDEPNVRRCYRNAYGCEYHRSAAKCSCSSKQVWSGGSREARADRGGGGEEEAERHVMKWLGPKAAPRSIARAFSPARCTHVLRTNYDRKSAMKAGGKQTCLQECDDHGKQDHCPICKRLMELSIAAVTYIRQTIRARMWTCTSKRSLAKRYVPTPTRMYQHEVLSALSYTPRSRLDRYTGLPLRPRPSVASAAPEPPRKDTPPIPAKSPLREKIRLPSLVELDGTKSYRGENASRGHFKMVREPEGWALPSVAGPSDEERFARVNVRSCDEGEEYDGMLLPHA